jgi:alpha-tubulin suppressor-like RCC1 family protein
MVAVTGQGVSGQVGQPLQSPLAVRVSDRAGRPVSGVLVTFRTSASGGSLNPIAITTDTAGLASSVWTLPTVTGSYVATAAAAALDSVAFTVRAVAGSPATITILKGDSQQTMVGQQLDSALAIVVLDQYGNPVYGAVAHFTAAPGAGGATRFVTQADAQGVASTEWILGDSAGPMTLAAQVGTLAPLTFHASAKYLSAGPLAQLAVGQMHNCAIRTGGDLYCWGWNPAGQLGDGASFTTGYTPTRVVWSERFTTVVAGLEHTCGIATTGETLCWGQDGQNGSSLPFTGTAPIQVSGSHGFVQLAGGDWHTCGLEADGSVFCWGLNDAGQLGNGIPSPVEYDPVAVRGAPPFVTLSAGGGHTCGLTRSGATWCWGLNTSGQLGQGNQTSQASPVPVSVGEALVTISAGSSATCGLTLKGGRYCWGANFGRFGNGGFSNALLPEYEAFTPLAAISAGGEQTCGIARSGEGFCWGFNHAGEVGSGVDGFNLLPASLGAGLSFREIHASIGRHTCGFLTDDRVFCWGDNSSGQLGIGRTTERFLPTAQAGGQAYASLSVSRNTNCGIRVSGGLDCWGSNTTRLLVDATNPYLDFVAAPTPSLLAYYVTAIAIDGLHGCAIAPPTGTICWGWGLNGELGAGVVDSTNHDPQAVVGGHSFTSIGVQNGLSCGLDAGIPWCWGQGFGATPVVVPGAPALQSLTLGDQFACGIAVADSTAWCWGRNDFGQLGDGSTVSRGAAAPVLGGDRFRMIDGGGGHACGLTYQDAALCWGLNAAGQLGDGGSGTTVLQPTAVTGEHSFSRIGVGSNHTCAVTPAGAGYCWGINFSGQLGINDVATTLATVPTAVVGPQIWADIDGGDGASCGLTTNGAVYCWGSNTAGQLGLGQTGGAATPTFVF